MRWQRLPRIPKGLRRQAEEDLDAELRFHLEERIDDLVATGLEPGEARRRARNELRGLFAARSELLPGASGVERRRRIRWWLEEVGGDCREAVASLMASPGFSLVAVGTLALAIGATTGIFSVANAVMFRPLPYPGPDRLVAVHEEELGGSDRSSISTGTFIDWLNESTSFAALGAHSFVHWISTTDVDGRPLRIRAASVTPSAFEALGAQPVVGRLFRDQEGRPDASRVALLSWGFWQSRYGGDGGVIGSTLELDGRSHEIVGVMGPDFRLPDGTVDVWRILRLAELSEGQDRRTHLWHGVARLAPGVTAERADAELDAISARLESLFPEDMTGWRARVRPLHEDVTRTAGPLMWVLLGFVGVVLLMACANLASLTLARFTLRERELAVRSALGAGRRRLVRRALVETSVMAVLGGGLGVLVGLALMRLFVVIAPPDIPLLDQTRMDPTVLAFAAAVTLVSVLLVGVLPSVRASSVDPASALQEGRWGSSGGGSRSRLRAAILVVQVAFSTVLLVGAGLLVRTMAAYRSVDYGYRQDDLMSVLVMLPVGAGQTFEEQEAFFGPLLSRVEAVPGVEAVTATSEPPVVGFGVTFGFAIESAPRDGADPFEEATDLRVVQPSYFEVMGQPVLRGRGFRASDDGTSPRVAVVNESLARRHWPGRDPIGDRISLDGPGGPWIEIVGVAADTRHDGAEAFTPAIYVLWDQTRFAWMTWQTLMIRTALDPATVTGAVREAVWSLNGSVPVDPAVRVVDLYAESRGRNRFAAQLLVAFAVVGLILGTVGLYGVLAYSVGARRREIGVRLALGGTRVSVSRRVLGHGLRLCLAGLALGVPAALAGARVLESLVFGVGTRDPVTFTAIPVLLLLVAAGASWLPARRAAATDPASVLRND